MRRRSLLRPFGKYPLLLALCGTAWLGCDAGDPTAQDTVGGREDVRLDGQGPDAGLEDTLDPADTRQPNDDASLDDATQDGADIGQDARPDTGPPRPPAGGPGRVPLHRLNRAEYNNTVQALLGTAQRPADSFPDDDHGYGYDNIAAVLSTTPTHVEMYLSAAESLVEEALAVPMIPPNDLTIDPLVAGGTSGQADGGRGWLLWSNGVVQQALNLERAGDWQIEVDAGGSAAAGVAPELAIQVDGATLQTFAVTTSADVPRTYRVTAPIVAGTRTIAARFTNDYYDEASGEDRNLWVAAIRLTGPLNAYGPPNPLRERWVQCEMTALDEAGYACAEQTVLSFATQAWRRPLSADAESRLQGLLATLRAAGDTPEEVLRAGFVAVLVSPRFVYRWEQDPADDTAPRALDDWEIASRLSYFLWSSPPDDTLRSLAAAGQLQDPAVRDAQVLRMLADPRAESLVENFAGQWLFIRSTQRAQPDPAVFPAFDEALRNAMVAEMQAFFRTFLREDRPITELLTGDDVFVNARLATHYGLAGSWGDALVRTTDPEGLRGGLLTQAGLLTALSYPHRTSPVLRGKWVLGQLLCQEPPPPPAGVEGLPEDPDSGPLSLRERMARHREQPDCAGCHASMDPIGLGLENFDAVGLWRTHDAAGWIDTAGTLPDGRSFSGPHELAATIAGDPGFTRCVTRQLFTYALGRGVTPQDTATIRAIQVGFTEDGGSFAALAQHLVRSDAFLQRTAAPAVEAP